MNADENARTAEQTPALVAIGGGSDCTDFS
jgi:hypothetical protein